VTDEFQRDPGSSFNHITGQEVRNAILSLIPADNKLRERARDGLDKDLQAILDDKGGWNVLAVLKSAAAVIVTENLPSDRHDVRVVRQALRDRIC
jgi:hypothetical protein